MAITAVAAPAQTGRGTAWIWRTALVATAAVIAVPVLAVVASLGQPFSPVWQHLLQTVLSDYVLNSLVLMTGVGPGTLLLGVKAVIARSFERIHRSNLIGMGVLPLQFKAGEDAASLGLTGTETFDIIGLGDGSAKEVTVTATATDGAAKTFQARVRIDTPQEFEYYRNCGILHFVLRQLAA